MSKFVLAFVFGALNTAFICVMSILVFGELTWRSAAAFMLFFLLGIICGSSGEPEEVIAITISPEQSKKIISKYGNIYK